MTGDGGIKEGVANVFSAKVMNNAEDINALKDLCPETYKAISDIWDGKYEKRVVEQK